MKSPKRATEDETAADRRRAVAPLDSGETRAIMVGAVILAVFLYFIKLILLPFVLAAIVAYICTPLLDWAARRTKWPRILFAIGLFFILIGITGLIIAVAAKRLIAESTEIAAGLQGMLENFVRQAEGDKPVSLFGLSMNTHDLVQTVLVRVRDWIGQTDQIEFLVGYSFIAFMGGLFWIVPPHRRSLVARIWARLDPVLMRYFIGVIAVVAYATVAAYIGLGVILGIKQAVFLALLTGILEIVPFVGPTSAAVIAGLASLRTASGIINIVEYAAYATLLRLSIDQIVGPVVLGRAARVHPVLIIFCFLAGGIVLGIPGIILAVPIALLVKSALATIYGDADA
jgi:predicted PurR-regulated permease PerM